MTGTAMYTTPLLAAENDLVPYSVGVAIGLQRTAYIRPVMVGITSPKNSGFYGNDHDYA